MEGFDIFATFGTVINLATIGLAYWLLKVRDRLLLLEKDYAHLQEKVEGGADDIAEIKDSLNAINKGVNSLVVELRAKGVINGAHRPRGDG